LARVLDQKSKKRAEEQGAGNRADPRKSGQHRRRRRRGSFRRRKRSRRRSEGRKPGPAPSTPLDRIERNATGGSRRRPIDLQATIVAQPPFVRGGAVEPKYMSRYARLLTDDHDRTSDVGTSDSADDGGISPPPAPPSSAFKMSGMLASLKESAASAGASARDGLGKANSSVRSGLGLPVPAGGDDDSDAPSESSGVLDEVSELCPKLTFHQVRAAAGRCRFRRGEGRGGGGVAIGFARGRPGRVPRSVERRRLDGDAPNAISQSQRRGVPFSEASFCKSEVRRAAGWRVSPDFRKRRLRRSDAAVSRPAFGGGGGGSNGTKPEGRFSAEAPESSISRSRA
ncbi:hypothetical protein ACHAWF_017716, partial [Thalassiosira exigua]